MQHFKATTRERSPEVERARELRLNATPAERLLWSALKGKQLKGLKFRRQSPIGPYIVDFVCFSARLIIELDGDQHSLPNYKPYDERRDAWLSAQNFRVLRFRNQEVSRDFPLVLATIAHAAENRVLATKIR